MRADQLLVERGLAASKSQAQRLIASGVRWRLLPGDWTTVSKNGQELRETVELQAVDNVFQFPLQVCDSVGELPGGVLHVGDVVTLRLLDAVPRLANGVLQ